MRSEQSAGWSCSECKPIRARAHYVALSAATPSPINIRRTAISRGHTTARTTAVVSTCEILPNAFSAWRGQMTSRSENFRIIAGAHSIENEFGGINRGQVVVSPTAKLRIPGHRIRATRLPDESRYGRIEVKKAVVRRRSVGHFVRVARIPWGGGGGCTCVRACGPAPF
jgi:hypothetical protein